MLHRVTSRVPNRVFVQAHGAFQIVGLRGHGARDAYLVTIQVVLGAEFADGAENTLANLIVIGIRRAHFDFVSTGANRDVLLLWAIVNDISNTDQLGVLPLDKRAEKLFLEGPSS